MDGSALRCAALRPFYLLSLLGGFRGFQMDSDARSSTLGACVGQMSTSNSNKYHGHALPGLRILGPRPKAGLTISTMPRTTAELDICTRDWVGGVETHRSMQEYQVYDLMPGQCGEGSADRKPPEALRWPAESGLRTPNGTFVVTILGAPPSSLPKMETP